VKMLLKNCTIRKDKTDIEADILIKGDKIADVGKGLKDSGRTIDMKCMRVIPGIIDPHVHFREPGLTHKEDFLTGSMAAAAGGITTILDMPNTLPPTTTVALLDEKRRLAKKSLVNYGFHFGASADNIDEIKKAKNIASVKVFLNITTGKLMMTDLAALKRVLSVGRLVTAHAEGPMVERIVTMAEMCKATLYLCHISLESELSFIRKHKGPRLYVEATPHHLYLDSDADKDSFTKMKPALGKPSDREALWKELRGLVDCIGTDHAPHTADEKLAPEYPYGVPGCETMLALLLDAVNKGRLTIDDIIRLCCENPAKIFRIKCKGRIEPGYDADLTAIDMAMRQDVSHERLFSRAKWTPFTGMSLTGWPVMTIVNGNIVFRDGEIVTDRQGKEVEFQ
jgi:dihydroorotase